MMYVQRTDPRGQLEVITFHGIWRMLFVGILPSTAIQKGRARLA